MGQSSSEANTTVSWNFLSNHALALINIGRWPESTGLELAAAVGITERATRRILVDLQAAGYIAQEKVGRRNRYRVDIHRPLVRIGEKDLTAGQLLELVLGRRARAPARAGPRVGYGSKTIGKELREE